jgi:anaerobic magnesium-protoporphyrin IX monomethyl ester cyclase
LTDLCNALENGSDASKIPNLWIKQEGKVLAKNNIRPALDVNTLPVQDLSIFDEQSLFRPMKGTIYKMAPVETQRGCPYACRFCNSPEKNEFYQAQEAGRFFRKRTMKHLHTELKEIISKFGIEYIFFITDTFLAMSEKEFDEFCEMYKDIKLLF